MLIKLSDILLNRTRDIINFKLTWNMLVKVADYTLKVKHQFESVYTCF